MTTFFPYLKDPEDRDQPHTKGEDSDDKGAHDRQDVPEHILDAEQDWAKPKEERLLISLLFAFYFCQSNL